MGDAILDLRHIALEEIRLFFEIGRRNMWGKNRQVNLFTRLSARTRDTVTSSGAGVRPKPGRVAATSRTDPAVSVE